MNIGILDDNPVIGNMLQEALNLSGYRATSYTDTQVFLARATQEPQSGQCARFDMLIVDFNLAGGFSGAEVIQRVRLYDSTLPIILLSAASEHLLQKIRGAFPGVIIVNKPFKITELLAALERRGVPATHYGV